MALHRFTLIITLIVILAAGLYDLGIGATSPGKSAKPIETYLNAVLAEGRYVSRWNDSTTTLRINIQPGFKVPGWSPVKDALVKSAFSEWERAMHPRFRFVYTSSPYETDLLVNWQLDAKGETVGVTKDSWNKVTQTLTDTHVVLSLRNPQKTQMDNAMLYATALHEIGHALGIKGHSPNKSDIMYPIIQPQVTHLSPRDIATMKALYALKPDITNPVGISFARYQRYREAASRGYTYLEQHQNQHALTYFKKAETYYPQDPYIAYYIGVSAYRLKSFPLAIESLEKSLKTLPSHYQDSAQFFLAGSLGLAGNDDMTNGQVDLGKQKLARAQTLYENYLTLSETPKDMRDMASANLAIIRRQLAETTSRTEAAAP